MQKVVITGCAGMIGSHLADDLVAQGDCEVVGIDNFAFGTLDNLATVIDAPSFVFHRADVLDEEKMMEICTGASTLVHLAALKKIAEKDAALPTLRVNSRGTEIILAVAGRVGCKVVLASTSDVYGLAPVPHREDANLILGPGNIKRWSYAVSKLYNEQLAFAHFNDAGVPIVVLRYFGGFSPRSSASWSGGHIPLFIDAILHRKTITIHGDGSQTRSMTHVADLVRGTIAAMDCEAAVGEIVNIGTDEELSVLENAEIICEVIGEVTGSPRELNIDFVPIKDVFGDYTEIARRVPDLSKARRLLDYEPKYTFRDAIRETVRELVAAVS